VDVKLSLTLYRLFEYKMLRRIPRSVRRKEERKEQQETG
jgi:hypothetical protein